MLEALPDFWGEGLVGTGAGEVDEDAAQGVYQSVGGCGELQAQLVGTEVMSAGAVGEEIELLFFDPVFYLATRAVFDLNRCTLCLHKADFSSCA